MRRDAPHSQWHRTHEFTPNENEPFGAHTRTHVPGRSAPTDRATQRVSARPAIQRPIHPPAAHGRPQRSTAAAADSAHRSLNGQRARYTHASQAKHTPHGRTAALPHCCSVTLSHCHAVTLSPLTVAAAIGIPRRCPVAATALAAAATARIAAAVVAAADIAVKRMLSPRALRGAGRRLNTNIHSSASR